MKYVIISVNSISFSLSLLKACRYVVSAEISYAIT